MPTFQPVAGWEFGNGVKHTRLHDANYRIVSITANGSLPFSMTYTRDVMGNVAAMTEGSVSRTYDHDALGRLRREKLPSGTIVESFDYDPVGNRRSRSLGATTTSYQYPPGSHRLSAVGSATRSYTGNGNTSLMTDETRTPKLRADFP